MLTSFKIFVYNNVRNRPIINARKKTTINFNLLLIYFGIANYSEKKFEYERRGNSKVL